MKNIIDLVNRVLEYIVILLFSAIISTALAQVFFRFALRTSIYWVNEIDIQLTIWAVWLCAPIGIYRKTHMKITILSDRFSKRTQHILLVLIDLSTLLFLIVLGIKGIAVIRSVEGMTLMTLPIPSGLIFAAAPVGACLMIFFFIPSLVEDFKKMVPQQKK